MKMWRLAAVMLALLVMPRPAAAQEATVPAGAAEPGLFQQSPRFLDGAGRPVRFVDNYLNMYPPPPRAGQGGQQ